MCRASGVPAFVLGVALCALCLPGCRRERPSPGDEALALKKLIRSACHARDHLRLIKVEKRVQAAVTAGKMTAAEGLEFEKILRLARSGEWEAAEKASLEFARDQLGRGEDETGGRTR